MRAIDKARYRGSALKRAVDAIVKDHWVVEKRYPMGYMLLSGAGTNGGEWAAKGQGETKKFSNRSQAEEHIEASLGE